MSVGGHYLLLHHHELHCLEGAHWPRGNLRRIYLHPSMCLWHLSFLTAVILSYAHLFNYNSIQFTHCTFVIQHTHTHGHWLRRIEFSHYRTTLVARGTQITDEHTKSGYSEKVAPTRKKTWRWLVLNIIIYIWVRSLVTFILTQHLGESGPRRAVPLFCVHSFMSV